MVLVSASAAAGRAAAAESKARVYTNADLEKFGSPASAAAPAAAFDETQAWRFVSEFLERQTLALEAERRLEIERRAIEASRSESERWRPRLVAPFAGVFGTTLIALPFRFPRLEDAPAPRPAAARTSPHGRPFDPRAFMSSRPALPPTPAVRSR